MNAVNCIVFANLRSGMGQPSIDHAGISSASAKIVLFESDFAQIILGRTLEIILSNGVGPSSVGFVTGKLQFAPQITNSGKTMF